MRGRHGDEGEVDDGLGLLVVPGAEGRGRTGLGGVVVDEVDPDAAAREHEGGGGADQSGADDERGPHWAMSLRRAPAAPR